MYLVLLWLVVRVVPVRRLLRAKSQIKGVTDAFRVLKTKSSGDINVIINMDAVSKKQILDAKDDVLKLDGVKSIKYRIAD